MNVVIFVVNLGCYWGRWFLLITFWDVSELMELEGTELPYKLPQFFVWKTSACSSFDRLTHCVGAFQARAQLLSEVCVLLIQ